MRKDTEYRYGEITKQFPFLLTFQSLLVIVSILIILSSSLVIKQIHNKKKKTRADEMFLILMISDITVAIISMPALGVLSPLWNELLTESANGSKIPFAATAFCFEVPYTFSYMVTVIIAVDRLFIITQHRRYERIITRKRLKCIVACTLTFVIVYGIVNSYVLPQASNDEVTGHMRKGYLIFNTVTMWVIFSAYIYILFFVKSRSNALKQSKHGKVNKSKKLSKTIFYIFTFQIICILPYLIMHMMIEFSVVFPVLLVAPWLALMRNTQGFCDGLILLRNQKDQKEKTVSPKSNMTLIDVSSETQNNPS